MMVKQSKYLGLSQISLLQQFSIIRLIASGISDRISVISSLVAFMTTSQLNVNQYLQKQMVPHDSYKEPHSKHVQRHRHPYSMKVLQDYQKNRLEASRGHYTGEYRVLLWSFSTIYRLSWPLRNRPVDLKADFGQSTNHCWA